MDPTYPRFATTDPLYYDDPRRAAAPPEGRFFPDETLAWTRWRHIDDGHWSYWGAPLVGLPDQGWKVHVSAVASQAREMLASVSRYCHHHALSFKHLSHARVFFAANSKEGDRSGSGKFITIYPPDEAALHDSLVDLDGIVGGLPGPHVLSDLRWNAGPLSVRYGAFAREFADVDGRRVAALRRPDDELVEDVRGVQFVVPPWVSVPPFLDAQRASLADTTPPEGFPSVIRALHHSNAGGVYEGVEPDGTRVVLKEARPHTGLTPDGRDAVTRVRDEAGALARIDSPHVVRMRRAFDVHGHLFLVTDLVEGIGLNKAVVSRHPLVRASSTAPERTAFRDWALDIARRIEAAVGAIHAAGLSHGDLHPGNVLVDADDEVVLIDLEMARPLADRVPAVIGAPGFVPRDDRGGERLDRYALACLKLFLFAPLTPLIGIDPKKLDDLVDWARERFELSEQWVADVIAGFDLPPSPPAPGDRTNVVIDRWRSHHSPDLEMIIDALSADLVGAADFTRADRAWPGDPAQFVEAPAAVAHGAGGVLVALRQAGSLVPDQAWDWYRASAERELLSPDPRLGLFDGLAGIAWTQRTLGLHVDADRTIDRLRLTDVDRLGPQFYGGLSGIGLVLLAESRADASLLPLVMHIAERVHRQFDARPVGRATKVAVDQGGLFRGWSGVALFASRLFATTEEPAHLDLAHRALDADLATCVRSTDGSLQVNEGWRTMPYLGSGSAGIGFVLAELIPRLPTRSYYEDMLEGIRRAASSELVVNPGLLQGRAGLIHLHLALGRAGLSTPQSDEALAMHVRALSLHATRRPNGIAFPGLGLMRLSCDLATGGAGVLSSLAAYRDLMTGSHTLRHAVPFLDLPTDASTVPLAGTTDLLRR